MSHIVRQEARSLRSHGKLRVRTCHRAGVARGAAISCQRLSTGETGWFCALAAFSLLVSCESSPRPPGSGLLQPLPDYVDWSPIECEAPGVVSGVCDSNAESPSPSWCRMQNPLIQPASPSGLHKIPQPPAADVAATNDGFASDDWTTPTGYRRQYHCADDDPFTDCSLIDQFVALELPLKPSAAVKTLRVVIVGRRVSVGDEPVASRLDVLDDHFDLLFTPVSRTGQVNILGVVEHLVALRAPWAGDLGTFILAVSNSDECEAVDGTVYNACSGYQVVDFTPANADGRLGPYNWQQALKPVLYDVEVATVTTDAFMFEHMGRVVVARVLFTTDQAPGAQSAGYSIIFTVLQPGNTESGYATSPPQPPASTAGTVNATWSLVGIGTDDPRASLPAVRVSHQYYYDDCSTSTPGPAFLTRGSSGFFTDRQCGTRASIVQIVTPERVILRRFDFAPSRTIDVSDEHLTGVFLQVPSGWLLRDAALLAEFSPPATITNASLSAPGSVVRASQSLTVVAAMRQPSRSSTRVVWAELREFAVVDPPMTRSFANPAGVNLDAGHGCTPNGIYDTTLRLCVDRTSASRESDLDVTEVVAQWRDLPGELRDPLLNMDCSPRDFACLQLHASTDAKHSSAQLQTISEALSASTTPAPEERAAAFVNTLYGLRHAVFVVSTANVVDVYHALKLPDGCLPYPEQPMSSNVRFVNSLTLAGPARHIYVTPNAQFVFAAVQVPQWRLHARERVSDVCDRLSADPSDPFLAPFTKYCSFHDPTEAPQLPSLTDFMQSSSACYGGTHCPSFNEEQIAIVPDQYYSASYFDVTACPPGSYCQNGRREECPSGFICDIEQMSQPTPCEFDDGLNTNCYGEGNDGAVFCDPGELCGVPYEPAVPAPPGFATAQGRGSFTRTLVECNVTEWCGLGRTAYFNRRELLCPNSTYCSSPRVVEPVVCNGTFPGHSTPLMPYCPAGTTSHEVCPAGWTCAIDGERKECEAGSFCPAGTSPQTFQTCPERFVCSRDATTKRDCPQGYFCPSGTVEPKPCGWLSICSCGNSTNPTRGCKSPANFLSVPVLVLVPLALWVSWKLWKKYVINKRRSKRDERLARSRTLELRGGASSSRISVGRGSSGESAAPGDGVNPAPLLGTSTGSSVAGMSPKEFTIDIAFDDLGLALNNGKKDRVMQGVSGQLRHGRVCAVMGPSGAGKSTFVTTVAGKAYYGTQLGTIRINGRERSLADFHNLVGFVPQEDIMMRDLTVEENLTVSALSRLPTTWSEERKRRFVDDTISLLGLREIKDKKIGDENKRGISGGQRKRVNIGMELVADPTVLFLDEPTSGLDSTSSLEVCDALRCIADLGITVVTVIHQPRYEIFTSFHDVCLLAKGGRLVYLGPSEKALSYFESLGHPCPALTSPPDHFMDTIAADATYELVFHWTENREQFNRDNGIIAAPGAMSGTQAEIDAVNRDSAGFFSLTWLYLKRALMQQARSKKAIATDLVMCFVAAGALALVYKGSPMYKPPYSKHNLDGCPGDTASLCQACLSASVDQILARASMTCIAVGLTGVSSMVRIFGRERVVYFREASGLPQPRHTLAYFLGKDISMLPQMFIAPFLYTIVYYSSTTPSAPFSVYYAVILALYYTSSAFAFLVSVIAAPSGAQLIGVVIVFFNAMFSGGMRNLRSLEDSGAPLSWLPVFSYMRYACEALYVREIVEYEDLISLNGVNLSDFLHNKFAYSIDAFEGDVMIIFGIGLLLRLTTFLVMWLKDREKKL